MEMVSGSLQTLGYSVDYDPTHFRQPATSQRFVWYLCNNLLYFLADQV